MGIRLPWVALPASALRLPTSADGRSSEPSAHETVDRSAGKPEGLHSAEPARHLVPSRESAGHQHIFNRVNDFAPINENRHHLRTAYSQLALTSNAPTGSEFSVGRSSTTRWPSRGARSRPSNECTTVTNPSAFCSRSAERVPPSFHYGRFCGTTKFTKMRSASRGSTFHSYLPVVLKKCFESKIRFGILPEITCVRFTASATR